MPGFIGIHSALPDESAQFTPSRRQTNDQTVNLSTLYSNAHATRHRATERVTSLIKYEPSPTTTTPCVRVSTQQQHRRSLKHRQLHGSHESAAIWQLYTQNQTHQYALRTAALMLCKLRRIMTLSFHLRCAAPKSTLLYNIHFAPARANRVALVVRRCQSDTPLHDHPSTTTTSIVLLSEARRRRV